MDGDPIRPRRHSKLDYPAEILPVCPELGVGFVAYAPLGRGLLSQRFHGWAIDHNPQSAAKFAGARTKWVVRRHSSP